MKGIAESVGWNSADWLSELWLHGTCRCLEITGSFLDPGSRVLDYGCGVGFLTTLLNRMGFQATGIDIDVGGQPEAVGSVFAAPWGTRRLEKANPGFITECWGRAAERYGLEFLSFDGMCAPFSDASFDAIFAHAVIEHVRPDLLPAIIKDMGRLLKEGGILLVFRTPRKKSYLEKLFRLGSLRKYGHQILYNEAELEDLAAGEGFQPVYEGVTDMFPAFPPRGMRLYNLASPVLAGLESVILSTPLKRYAHHMALVFRKETRRGCSLPR